MILVSSTQSTTALSIRTKTAFYEYVKFSWFNAQEGDFGEKLK